MYLERTEVTAAARGASDQPQLEMETTVTTTAQAGDDEVKEGEEEEVPDARLYYFLEPAQVRSQSRLHVAAHTHVCARVHASWHMARQRNMGT